MLLLLLLCEKEKIERVSDLSERMLDVGGFSFTHHLRDNRLSIVLTSEFSQLV